MRIVDFISFRLQNKFVVSDTQLPSLSGIWINGIKLLSVQAKLI